MCLGEGERGSRIHSEGGKGMGPDGRDLLSRAVNQSTHNTVAQAHVPTPQAMSTLPVLSCKLAPPTNYPGSCPPPPHTHTH